MKKGLMKDSPLKKGPVQRMPLTLFNAVRLHIKMKQLGRSKQATLQDTKAVMLASVKDTEHEGSFNIEYTWARLRELYPNEIVPSKVQTAENIRSDWTTYTKLNDWFTMNKPMLINSGLAIDRPHTLPDGTLAELTIHPDCARRIINFDETDHPFSTQGDKGGSRNNTYGNPSLPAGSTRGIRGARHTTSIYGSTASGESMPPVYIYDTKAKQTDNFKLKPSWTKNLPKVRGQYGCPTIEEYSSSLCVFVLVVVLMNNSFSN